MGTTNRLFTVLIIFVLITTSLSITAWSQQSGTRTLSDSSEGGMNSPFNMPEGFGLDFTVGLSSSATIILTNADTKDTWSSSNSFSFDSGRVFLNWEIDFDSTGLPPGPYDIEETFSGTVTSSGIVSFPPLNLAADPFTWSADIPAGAKIVITAEVSGSGSASGDFSGPTNTLVLDSSFTFSVVSNKALKAGEFAKFGLSFSAELTKDTVIVPPANQPPILNSVVIGVKVDDSFDPGVTAYTNSVLGVVSIDATDDYTSTNDLKKIYQWLKNGNPIPTATGATLDGTNFNKGDNISLKLIVKDGSNESSNAVESNVISIADSLPSKPEVAIVARGAPAGTPLTRAHDLFCQIITESVDPDGEPVEYRYEWSKDDALQPSLTGAVVGKELFQKGQVWKCVVTPVSGGVDGPNATASGTIENAPLTIDAIDNQAVTETQTLNLLIPIVDADGDADINAPTFQISPAPEETSPEIVSGSYRFVWETGRNDSDDATGSKTYEVTITANDKSGVGAERTFTITVINLNRPVEISISGKTASKSIGDDISITVTVTDDDSDSLWTYSASVLGDSTTSLNAAISAFNADGETDAKTRIFSWTPTNAEDTGKNFQIRFTVKDNGTPTPTADQKTVTLSVDANQPPALVVKRGADVVSAPLFMNEDESLTLSLTSTDPDVLDTVSLSVISSLMDDGIANFSSVDGNPATATFTLPKTGETVVPGVYSIAFKATDDNPANPLSVTRTVIINVNDVNESPEFLSTPTTQEVSETETVSFAVQAKDNDGDVLTISAEAVDADGNPVDFPASSQLSSLNFDPVTEIYSRTFTWTPGYDVTKEGRTITAARIVFRANDGRNEDNSISEQTWVIRVTDKNRAPVILEITGVQPIDEGETLSITVKAKDNDKEKVTLSSTALPGGGSFAKGASSFDSGTGITTVEMTWTAPFDVATAADPIVSEIVTITADDGNAEYNTDTEDITAVVNNVNRPVELTISSNSPVNEGDEMQVAVEGTDPDAEDNISLELIGFPGTRVDIGSNSGSHVFTWTPGYDVVTGVAASADIELTIKGDDNNGLPNSVITEYLTVTVNDKNQAPEVSPASLSLTVDEGQALVIGPSGTAAPPDGVVGVLDSSDPDGDPLDYSISPQPTGLSLAGAIVVWQPNFDQAGTYNLTYSVTDVRLDENGDPKTGEAASKTTTASIAIEVVNKNQAPVLDETGNQAFVVSEPNTITFTATDNDDDDLFYTLTPLPPGATLDEATGTLNWTPVAGDIGNYDVTVEVRDRENGADPDVLKDSETFTIAVAAGADSPPEISNITVASGEINEGETFEVTFDVSEPDNDDVTLSASLLTKSGESVTVNPTTIPGGNHAGATAQWVTDFEDAGSHELQIKATSTGISGIPLSKQQIVTFTVKNVNRLPQVSDVAISPTSPKGSDTLSVQYTYSDEDNDEENGTEIRWFKNGVEVTEFFNARNVPALMTEPGETWQFKVKPSDDAGKTFGDEAASNTVTIIDTPPELKNPSVSPAEGTVATEFEYSVTYEDKDNQAPDSVVVNISSPEITLSMTKDPADSDFTDGVEYTARISGLKKLPEGESHTYEFVATYGSEITSGPHTGPVIDDSPAVASAVLTVGNTGDIAISYTLTDADGEPANIRLDYSDNGGVIWTQNVVSKGNVAPGVGLGLTWTSPAGVDKKSYLVRVVPNGEVANAGISSAFIVDNKKPDAPTITTIGGRAVTDGTIAGSNVFGPGFAVDGAGEADAEARGYVDGAKVTGGSIDSGGNYSISFSGLTDGNHVIAITVFDGIHESDSKSLQIVVDTVEPTINVISPTDGSEISTRTPTFRARMEDVGSGLASYTVSVATNTYTMAYDSANKTASYTILEASALGQGVSYTAVFSATDKAGLTAQAIVSFTVNLGAADKIPPVIGDLSPVDGAITNAANVQIGALLVDSESGIDDSTVSVKFKKEGGAEQTLPHTLSVISATERRVSATATATESGNYIISVSVSDKATPNPNSAQANWTITVDIDAPPSIAFDPSIPTLTNQLAITVMGSAEPNSTVAISTNGGSPVNTTADGNTGDFTVSGIALSREGKNSITGIATDAAGNSSSATILEVDRDTVSPLISDLFPASGAVIGEPQPTIYLKMTDAYGIDTDSIQFSFDGASVSFDYDADSGQLSYRPDQPFGETGTHTFSASVKDIAGNQSAEFSSSFLYQAGLGDNVAPAISNLQLKDRATYTVSAIVSDSTQVNSITIQATGPAGTTTIPHGVPLPAASVNLEFSFDVADLQVDGTLPDGIYTITIYAEDAVGNSAQRGLTVEKDTFTPAPSLNYEEDADKSYINASGRVYTDDSDITLIGSGVESGAVVTLYQNGRSIGTFVANSDVQMSVSLSLGENEIKAKAKDSFGNESDDSNILNFTFDLLPPIISGLRIQNSVGDVTGLSTNDGEITVEFTVAEPQDATNAGVDLTQTILTIKKDGVTISSAPPSSAGPNYSEILSLSEDGEYMFIVEAEDALGNRANAQAAFILDTEKPIVSINTPSGDVTQSAVPNITATVDGFDIDISKIEMKLGPQGGPLNAVSHIFIATAGGGNISYVPGDVLEDGKFYEVEVTAFDLAGNSASSSKAFQVVVSDDTIGPIIAQLIPTPDGTISSTQLQIIAFVLADEFSGVDPATVLVEINGYTYTLEELLGGAGLAEFRKTGRVVVYFRNLRLLQHQPASGPLDISQLERPTTLISGKNTVRVQASDKAGNISETQWSFNVVTQPPSVPILKEIVSPTSKTNIVVEGTVPNVSSTNPVSVIVTVNGAISGRGSVNADDGSFKIEDAPLSEGANTIRAYAIDSVGNQGQLTSPIEVVLDQRPPIVTLEALPQATNKAEIMVRANIADNLSFPISAVNLVLNGVPTEAPPKAAVEIPVTLAAGKNSIMVDAFDAAGNKGSSSEATVELDTTPLDIAVENLGAKIDLTGGKIQLSWQKVTGASGYNIYRSETDAITDATGLEPIIQNVLATSTVDETAIPATTYFYAVTALDDAGNENKQLVSNSPNATLIIATNGGQAVLPDGTKATLKPNGIAENVLLSASVAINVLDDSSAPQLDRALPGSIREFTIAMQDGSEIEAFKKAAQISIPYSKEIEDTKETPRIFVLAGDSWTKVEDQTTDTEANIVTANVKNFGIYRLAIPAPLRPWDINNDAQVDISDLVLVGAHFGEAEAEVGDVNNDRIVDISDLVLVGVHFGEIYEEAAAPQLHSTGSPQASITLSAVEVNRNSEFGVRNSEFGVRNAELNAESGRYIKVSVKAETSKLLSGFQFDLQFDSNLLKVVTVQEGEFLKTNGNSTFWLPPKVKSGLITNIASAAFKEESGKAKGESKRQRAFSHFPLPTSHFPLPKGELASVTFKVNGEVAKALKSVRIQKAKLVDSNAKVIGFNLNNTIQFESITARVPANALLQNYPNPFNPETWIPYQLAQDTRVNITIYNVLGQVVRTLELGWKNAGEYVNKNRAAYWDGKNSAGEQVANGIYLYQIQAGKFTATKKLVILK